MLRVGVIVLCIGLALTASIERERRATGCDDNVPNPCDRITGKLYFPHPTDATRFLQCADGGRMFIIKCPAGESYDSDMMRCAAPTVVTQPPTQTPGGTMTNPCTPAVMASGTMFLPMQNSLTEFIECLPGGNSVVLKCPSRLVFSAAKQGCALPAGGAATVGPSTGTGGSSVVHPGTGIANNPCTAAAVAANTLFFPFGPDKTKFIHCDLAGDPFIMQCPSNLVWYQQTTRCESAFQIASGQIG